MLHIRAKEIIKIKITLIKISKNLKYKTLYKKDTKNKLVTIIIIHNIKTLKYL